MKTSNSIMPAIAALIVSTSLSAGNPESLAVKIAGKLSKDIALTDSQIVLIQEKAAELAVKRENADTLNDNTERTELKRTAANTYKAFVDSLLTNEQRLQLRQKQSQRTEAVVKKGSKKTN